MTNLRLPGQYDERLLGSVGLQGPYYNWNRWYMPGVGRYLELEPLLQEPNIVAARMETGHQTPAYAYAEDNPLTVTDPDGRGISTDRAWCMESVGCKKNIWCGGTKLELVSCGTGCDRCPTLPGNVFTSDWCAYATTGANCPQKTGARFRPAVGGVGGWIEVCYP